MPENRSDPGSRLIALPVIRVRATGDNPAEPILCFAGGPGGSNLHFQRPQDVIENHELFPSRPAHHTASAINPLNSTFGG